MTKHKAKVGGNKKQEVKQIQKLFSEYPIVGLVNLENLPALQYMRMKHSLKKKAVFKMSKKSVIKKALEGLDMPNLDKFRDQMKGMPILLFTKENPFSLAKTINENKSNAAAKAGQESPNDIVIPAGPTDFAAGPMIGEFGALGIKTEVKEGKIAIREEAVIVKEGDVIDEKIAGLLTKLGIEPMEIGLNLLLTYEKGEITPKEVLNVNAQDYIDVIKQSFHEGINLAVKIGFISKESVEVMVKKSQLEVLAVANKANVDMEKEMEVKEVEEKAEETPVEEKKEEVKEEVKEEAPAEEEKQEEVKEEVKEEAEEVQEDEQDGEEVSDDEVVDEVEEDAEDNVEEEEKKEEEVEEEAKEVEEENQEEAPEEAEEVKEVQEEVPKEEEKQEETQQLPEPKKEEPKVDTQQHPTPEKEDVKQETQQLPEPDKEEVSAKTQQHPQPDKDDEKIDANSFDLQRELKKADKKYDSDKYETTSDGRLVPKKEKKKSFKEVAEEQRGDDEVMKKAEDVAKKVLKGK